MKLADQYDVICSGGGLSTYLCAGLLAKAGRKVLVIDEPGYSRSLVSESGVAWDPDFAILGGLYPQGAIGLSLLELGFELGQGTRFLELDAITQILAPDFRIALRRESFDTTREIERELRGKAGASAVQFLDLLYRAGREIPAFADEALTLGQAKDGEDAQWRRFWGRYYPAIRSQKPQALRTLFSSDQEVNENLAAAALGAMSYASPFNLGTEQVIRSMPVLLQGKYQLAGQAFAVRKQIESLILEAGGGVKRNTRVEAVVAEAGKITGLLLSSFEGIVRSNVVVLGGRLKRLYLTLPPEMQDQVLLRALDRIEPSHWRFTLMVTVAAQTIPIGATSSMVAVESYHHALEEENFVHIQILPRELENSETVTLLVTAFVPFRSSALDYVYLRRLAGKMLHVLAKTMPFSDQNIVAIYPDFRKSDEPLRKAYPFEAPDWVPESLLQYYVRGERWAQDFWGAPWVTSHRNLYLTGRGIWPSLGSYGEALVARKVSADILTGFQQEGGTA